MNDSEIHIKITENSSRGMGFQAIFNNLATLLQDNSNGQNDYNLYDYSHLILFKISVPKDMDKNDVLKNIIIKCEPFYNFTLKVTEVKIIDKKVVYKLQVDPRFSSAIKHAFSNFRDFRETRNLTLATVENDSSLSACLPVLQPFPVMNFNHTNITASLNDTNQIDDFFPNYDLTIIKQNTLMFTSQEDPAHHKQLLQSQVEKSFPKISSISLPDVDNQAQQQQQQQQHYKHQQLYPEEWKLHQQQLQHHNHMLQTLMESHMATERSLTNLGTNVNVLVEAIKSMHMQQEQILLYHRLQPPPQPSHIQPQTSSNQRHHQMNQQSAQTTSKLSTSILTTTSVSTSPTPTTSTSTTVGLAVSTSGKTKPIMSASITRVPTTSNHRQQQQQYTNPKKYSSSSSSSSSSYTTTTKIFTKNRNNKEQTETYADVVSKPQATSTPKIQPPPTTTTTTSVDTGTRHKVVSQPRVPPPFTSNTNTILPFPPTQIENYFRIDSHVADNPTVPSLPTILPLQKTAPPPLPPRNHTKQPISEVTILPDTIPHVVPSLNRMKIQSIDPAILQTGPSSSIQSDSSKDLLHAVSPQDTPKTPNSISPTSTPTVSRPSTAPPTSGLIDTPLTTGMTTPTLTPTPAPRMLTKITNAPKKAPQHVDNPHQPEHCNKKLFEDSNISGVQTLQKVNQVNLPDQRTNINNVDVPTAVVPYLNPLLNHLIPSSPQSTLSPPPSFQLLPAEDTDISFNFDALVHQNLPNLSQVSDTVLMNETDRHHQAQVTDDALIQSGNLSSSSVSIPSFSGNPENYETYYNYPISQQENNDDNDDEISSNETVHSW